MRKFTQFGFPKVQPSYIEENLAFLEIILLIQRGYCVTGPGEREGIKYKSLSENVLIQFLKTGVVIKNILLYQISIIFHLSAELSLYI
jgi:hypothetical protein